MPGYLGDLQSKVVHDLSNMKTECNIVNIKPKFKHYFIPDTVDEAEKEGFSHCTHCIQ